MTGTLADVARPAFGRHETFAPRYGWLHKGVAAAAADPGVFGRDDAAVVLGVGQNQARAIRYWLGAFKLAEEASAAGQRAKSVNPTWEANWLFGENGADPYLEEPGSLWLLHHWLLSAPCRAPTWWIAFNSMPGGRWGERELAAQVMRQAGDAGWKPPAGESVRRDISCLTAMYAPGGGPRDDPGHAGEDAIMSGQFRDLGLLDAAGDEDGRLWRFGAGGSWATRPPEVVAYACLDYAARAAAAPGSIAVERLAHEPGAPGRAFQMTPGELAGSLRRAARDQPGIAVAESLAGSSLVFSGPPRRLAWEVLDSHYGNARDRVPSRAEWAAQSHAAARPRPSGRRRARSTSIPGQAALWGPSGPR